MPYLQNKNITRTCLLKIFRVNRIKVQHIRKSPIFRSELSSQNLNNKRHFNFSNSHNLHNQITILKVVASRPSAFEKLNKVSIIFVRVL